MDTLFRREILLPALYQIINIVIVVIIIIISVIGMFRPLLLLPDSISALSLNCVVFRMCVVDTEFY